MWAGSHLPGQGCSPRALRVALIPHAPLRPWSSILALPDGRKHGQLSVLGMLQITAKWRHKRACGVCGTRRSFVAPRGDCSHLAGQTRQPLSPVRGVGLLAWAWRSACSLEGMAPPHSAPLDTAARGSTVPPSAAGKPKVGEDGAFWAATVWRASGSQRAEAGHIGM